MVNEEKYLREKMGQGNPFKTPEGYFDQFTDRLMKQLPEERQKPAIVRLLRPMLYAAVFVGILILGATFVFNNSQSSDTQQNLALATHKTAEQSAVTYSDTYIEDAANYAMIDNEEIYAYLSDF